MHTMIDTVFNVINFAARIGLVIYIVRKYVIRSVANAITYEQESKNLLEGKYQTIKEDSKQIEKKIQDQEALYLDLQNKFTTWKQVIDQEQADFEKSCIDRDKKAQRLFEQKQKNIQRKVVLQQELPMILDQVKHDIQVYLKQDPQHGKEYVQNIIANISQE